MWEHIFIYNNFKETLAWFGGLSSNCRLLLSKLIKMYCWQKKIPGTDCLLQNICKICYNEKEQCVWLISVFLRKSVKELISTLQNVILRQKYIWKIKKFCGPLSSATRTRCVAETNEKKVSYNFNCISFMKGSHLYFLLMICIKFWKVLELLNFF